MEILLKPFILDIFIVFYVMFMMILGYKKGFVVRLYDLLSTLLSLLIAFEISYPVSKIWIIYQLDPPLQMMSQTVNQFFIFIIIFIVFKLACQILGIFIKPVIEKIISLLKITVFFDHLLGVILSFFESLIFIYIALVIIISPLLSGGRDIIHHSIIGQTITQIVPQYTDEMIKFEIIKDFSNINLNQKDTTCVTIVTEILYKLDENKMIDEETLKTFMENYYLDVQNVSLEKNTYELLIDMCQKHDIDRQIIKGIIVSE